MSMKSGVKLRDCEGEGVEGPKLWGSFSLSVFVIVPQAFHAVPVDGSTSFVCSPDPHLVGR